MFTKQTRNCSLKNCKLGEYETIVQNGLAVTPSQMMELTQRGVPIAPANLGLVYDTGSSSLDFEPPLEHQRGIDITDMWEHREDVKSKMRSNKFKELLKSESHE